MQCSLRKEDFLIEYFLSHILLSLNLKQTLKTKDPNPSLNIKHSNLLKLSAPDLW